MLKARYAHAHKRGQHHNAGTVKRLNRLLPFRRDVSFPPTLTSDARVNNAAMSLGGQPISC